MKYEYNGEVVCVQETQTFGANFQKRDMVCREELGRSGKYQFLPFTFTKDNVTKLDGINPGDRVKVTFYLDGTKEDYYQQKGRCYAQFTGVEVTVVSSSFAAPAASTAPAANGPTAQHVQGATMQTAVAEWTDWKGDDKVAFGEFCKGLVKAEDGNPKASRAYTSADWAVVVNAIRDAVAQTIAGGASSPSQDPDDIGW